MASPNPLEENMTPLESRIENLEMKTTFQEETIDELNQQVIKLNNIIAQQQEKIALIIGRLQTVEPSNIATQAEETPPPHY